MDRYFKPVLNPIPALVQGLLIGARALGIEPATKDKSHASLIDSLFATAPQDSAKPDLNAESDGDSRAWNQFTTTLRLCRRAGDKESRDQPSWQSHLLNLVGARQGQAETVHAVDVMRLKPALEQCTSTWTFSAILPSSIAGTPDFASFRSLYSDLKKLETAVSKAQRRLLGWRGETIAWLGDPSEKDASIRDMKEAVEAARAAGLTTGLDVKGLLELLEEFRGAKVVAALDDTEKLDQESPRGTVLTVLGRGHDRVAQLCEQLGKRLDEFLKAVAAELASDEAKYGANPMQDAVSSLTTELEAFARVLQTLESL
jgi:Arc/MetJ family transcription regulator